jgi:hypothetical protein
MCGANSASISMPLMSTMRGCLPPNSVPVTARVYFSAVTVRRIIEW